jgi:hypothetical protein
VHSDMVSRAPVAVADRWPNVRGAAIRRRP